MDVYNNEIPKVVSNNTSLAVISLDLFSKKDESYYLQVFLNKCKYTEKKIIMHIHDNLSDFSSSSWESNEK